MKSKVLISILLIFFILLDGGIWISKNKKVSYMENRGLEKKPSFSVNSFLNGGFQEKLENYFLDHLIVRDGLVKVKNQAQLLMGKRCIGDIYFSKDETMQEKFLWDENQMFANVSMVNNWSKKVKKGVKITFMLVPNGVWVQKGKLVNMAVNDNQMKAINWVKSKLNKEICFVTPAGELKRQSNKYLYYNTDHHWTTEGAYIGYKKLAGALGFQSVPLSKCNMEILTDDFLGSFYSQAPSYFVKKDIITYCEKNGLEVKVYYGNNKEPKPLLVRKRLGDKDKFRVFLNGNHGKIKVSSNAPGNKKILILKDSYVNPIISLLASEYKDIYMLDLRYYRGNVSKYMKKNHINNVLFFYNVDFFNTNDDFMGLT